MRDWLPLRNHVFITVQGMSIPLLYPFVKAKTQITIGITLRLFATQNGFRTLICVQDRDSDLALVPKPGFQKQQLLAYRGGLRLLCDQNGTDPISRETHRRCQELVG